MVRLQIDSVRRQGFSVLLAILLGLAVRVPTLGDPLLEGAAGKQTHTAMVTRNLYRERATWTRPVVDDIGRPGYFVKEVPVLPVLVAAGYWVIGDVQEWLGRLLPALAWLSATPFVARIAHSLRPGISPAIVALWYVLAPLGVAYSRAFMNDAPAVAASLGAFSLGVAWRTSPRPILLVATAVTSAGALLLKPHTAFWLAPAFLVLVTWPGGLGLRQRLLLLGAGGGSLALAMPWYLHAWQVHRTYPAPGAMVASGWVDSSLWLRSELYWVILAQEVWMVFTLPGLLLAGIGFASQARSDRVVPAALCAWAAGVVIQCVVLATRMFDEPARRTEYYQLAMVPVAAIWISLGVARLAAILSEWPRLRRITLTFFGVATLVAAATATLEALTPPQHYTRLLEDCKKIQDLTARDDEIAVLADRPGTVLYYCDRRGLALVPTSTTQPSSDVAPDEVGATARLASDLARVRFLYVPFPDLLEETPQLRSDLERNWRLSPRAPEGLLLYERRRTVSSAPGPSGRPEGPARRENA